MAVDIQNSVLSQSLWYEYLSAQKVDLGKKISKQKLAMFLQKESETLIKYSAAEIDKVFEEILNICLTLIDINISDNIDKQKQSIHTVLLRGSVLIVQAALKTDKISFSASMIKLSMILHNAMLDLENLYPMVVTEICELCTQIWMKDMPFKNEVWFNTFFHRLKTILSSTNESIIDEILTLYKLQPGLLNIDFDNLETTENDSSADISHKEKCKELLSLLFMAFNCGDFYSDRVGNRFLANIVILGKFVIKSVAATFVDLLKSSTPFEQCKAMGEILYHSWKMADDDLKLFLEENCIQDLMFRAIHSPRSRNDNRFKPYHLLLFSITSYKSLAQVRQMLGRLYAPILWRALKANNGMVRANASRLLLDAFPLEIPSASNSETLEFNEKQLQAMNDMLTDECHLVRIIGIQGVCILLTQYWDALPAHVIAIFAQTIFNKLAFDGSSADVRQAVYVGSIQLLDCVESHRLMARVLPEATIAGINDPSDNVRLDVLNMLDAVRQTNIKFLDIVPVTDLLQQLAVDRNNNVCKAISKLISGSFLPKDKGYEEWVKRCVNFYKRNTPAARKFYKAIVQQLTLQELGLFLEKLGLCLIQYVKSSVEDNVNTDQTMSEEEVQKTQSTKPKGNLECLYSLLETACIIWIQYQSSSCTTTKAKHKNEFRERMIKNLNIYSKAVHVCLRNIADERAINVVIVLASLLQPEHLPLFSKSLISKLRSMPSGNSSSYSEALIKCVFNWELSNQLLKLIEEWLTFNDDPSDVVVSEKPMKKSRKTRSKAVRFTVAEPEQRPLQAIMYLQCLLNHEADGDFPFMSKESNITSLNNIAAQLYLFMGKILDSKCSHITEKVSITEVVDIWCLIKIIIYRKTENESAITDISKVMAMYDEKITNEQKLSDTTIISQSSTGRSLAAGLIEKQATMTELLHAILKNCVYLLSTDIPAENLVEQFLLRIIEPENKVVLFDHCQNIISLINLLNQKKMLELSLEESANNDEKEMTKSGIEIKPHMIIMFNSLLCSMVNHSIKYPDSYAQVFRQSLKTGLKIVYDDNYLMHCSGKQPCSYEDIVVNSLFSCIESIKYRIKYNTDRDIEMDLMDIPPFASTLLPVLCGTAQHCAYVSECLCSQCLATDFDTVGEDKQNHLTAVAVLINTLIDDGKNKSAVIQEKDKACKDNPDLETIFSKAFSSMSEINDNTSTSLSKRPKVTIANLQDESNVDDIILFEKETPDEIEELHDYT